jgi:hypothetical protein
MIHISLVFALSCPLLFFPLSSGAVSLAEFLYTVLLLFRRRDGRFAFRRRLLCHFCSVEGKKKDPQRKAGKERTTAVPFLPPFSRVCDAGAAFSLFFFCFCCRRNVRLRGGTLLSAALHLSSSLFIPVP